MGFSWQLSASLARYLIWNKLRRRKRFPLVLMLEPTFKCNLTCAGCGRIREYHDIVRRMMSAEECLEAVDESSAPVVSITGGEPLLHPEIGQIVNGIISRGKFVNLCTNGLLLKDSLGKFTPSPYLSFVLHLDGLAETHDGFAGRKGVFDAAIVGIKAAKKAGFPVLINTTIYKETNLAEVEHLFTVLGQIPIDGIMVSPAFSYDAVSNEVFLSRQQIVTAFQSVFALPRRVPFYNTPIYREFLAGKERVEVRPMEHTDA